MELKDLTGEHMLDAVDFSNECVKAMGGDFEDSQTMRFRLGGVVYAAVEDPEDGYRSCMRELIVGDGPMTNTFTPVKVVGEYKSENADILRLVDAVTGQIVIEVGTDHSDDYYPCFVANFNAAAMAHNV